MGAVTSAAKGKAGDSVVDQVNEVRLRGRLAHTPQERELPSGDSLTTFRVIVDRTRSRRGDTVRRVDSIEVACWSSATRRAAARLRAGDIVDVEGALRRRFWRSGSGAVSRYEVEAATVRRGRVQQASG